MSLAQGSCSVATEEVERLLVPTNTHSQAKFRVLGPLANDPDFARDFSCEAGLPMNPKHKREVW